MQRLVKTPVGLCGIPTTVRASRKYLLAIAPIEISIHLEKFEVEKVYLKSKATSAVHLNSICVWWSNVIVYINFVHRDEQELVVCTLSFSIWLQPTARPPFLTSTLVMCELTCFSAKSSFYLLCSLTQIGSFIFSISVL